MRRFQNYAELDVWNEARKLVSQVYLTSKKFPKDDGSGLSQEICRRAVIIPAGIAEATGMHRSDDALDILFHSRSCLYEVEAMVYLAGDQLFISTEEMNALIEQITTCKRLINGFINYFRKSKGSGRSRRENNESEQHEEPESASTGEEITV